MLTYGKGAVNSAVLQGRTDVGMPHALAGAGAAQGDLVQQRHVVAHHCRLPNHNASRMVLQEGAGDVDISVSDSETKADKWDAEACQNGPKGRTMRMPRPTSAAGWMSTCRTSDTRLCSMSASSWMAQKQDVSANSIFADTHCSCVKLDHFNATTHCLAGSC